MPLTIYADFQTEASPRTTIAVIGLGYIGLPTAAALAAAGHRVIGYDVKPEVVSAVQAGESHIVEPGLDEMLRVVVKRGDLSAQNTPPEAEVYLIAVPTPNGEDEFRTPDLSYVFAAAEAIAPQLKPGALVDADPSLTLACLGLAFKADVDDFRESPSFNIARALSALYPGRVVCAEPYAHALRDSHGLTIVDAAEAVAAPVVVSLVAHSEFRAMMRPEGHLIDACGLWS